MIVVSDTSPIFNLSAVGNLDLLHDLYAELVVPPAVQAELSRNSIDLDALRMRIVEAQDRNGVAALREQLDPGEAEAIVVAAEIAAGLLLIDEKRGRRIAIDRGLEVTGLLGVLAEAKARGFIPKCQPILDDMIRVAGFWIGEDLRTRFLPDLNELDWPIRLRITSPSKALKPRPHSSDIQTEVRMSQAMVVDDSKAMRMILSRNLAEMGYDVCAAADGAEALGLLREEISLILVDWNMPRMNGLELVERLRADPRYASLKVMMVTTETEVDQMLKALAAGANEYVMKPFTKEILADKLRMLGLIP